MLKRFQVEHVSNIHLFLDLLIGYFLHPFINITKLHICTFPYIFLQILSHYFQFVLAKTRPQKVSLNRCVRLLWSFTAIVSRSL